MVTTRPPKTIVKPTALGPVANTDTKLLIYGLFQKRPSFGTGRGAHGWLRSAAGRACRQRTAHPITTGTQPVQKATHRGELFPHRRSVDQRGREGRSIHMLSDEMHDGLFQHRGGQSPAGEVLLATVLDEAPGDVVAEPFSVFLFGVARRQPVPGLVEELACQWGTGCTALRRASPCGKAARCVRCGGGWKRTYGAASEPLPQETGRNR